LQDLQGNRVDFAEFQGKPVLLNLWATWCPPCVAEMPSLNNLAANARLKGLPIVCVAVGDDPAAVKRFAEQNKLAMRVLLAVDPPPEAFQTQAIPATFVMDANGQIVVHEVGAAQWDAPQVVDFLDNLKFAPR
jgi:thiol-disulfide isomerase/thioredoxin